MTNKIYLLFKEQKEKIEISTIEIKAGKFLSNKEVFEKLKKKWRKRK